MTPVLGFDGLVKIWDPLVDKIYESLSEAHLEVDQNWRVGIFFLHFHRFCGIMVFALGFECCSASDSWCQARSGSFVLSFLSFFLFFSEVGSSGSRCNHRRFSSALVQLDSSIHIFLGPLRWQMGFSTISLHLSCGWAPNHLDGPLIRQCALHTIIHHAEILQPQSIASLSQCSHKHNTIVRHHPELISIPSFPPYPPSIASFPLTSVAHPNRPAQQPR